METRDLYVEELETEFEGIQDFDLGSEDHKRIVGDITQLTDRYVKLREVDIEEQKLDLEREKMDADKQKMEIETRKVDIETRKVDIEAKKLEFEREKMKEDRSDRWIRYVIDGLGIIVPAGITVTGMVLMFLFEEKGTITSRAGSKIVDRMFRSK